MEVYNDSEERYSIKYPINWKIEKNKHGVISIKSQEIKGGIYISIHERITFPDEYMKNFILESNNLPAEFEQLILSGEEDGIRSWYTSFTDPTNNLACMLAYKRKGEYLMFVSTEIDMKQWKNGWKETITEIILSIEMK